MKRSNQKGVALIFALIFLLILSVMAASLMFLAQSETWGSMNYRMMTQARYGAEAGVSAAANYLMYTYVPPGTNPADSLGSYDMTKSPVTLAGTNTPVVLSSIAGTAATYPNAGDQTAFSAATQNNLMAGAVTVNYVASAKLMSMRQINGPSGAATIQTWQITADGNINGSPNAQVEVSSMLERQIISSQGYAAFATGSVCGALTFNGGVKVDSYDSTSMTRNGSGNVITQTFGGNVGSNGNLNENGNSTTIYGTFSTPRTGVGGCASGNVDAWTNNGGATVTGGLVKLPQNIVYPPPTMPTPLPPTNTVNPPKNSTMPPGTYGNINLDGNATLHLTAGTYNINSLLVNGNSQIVVDSGPVVVNIAGQSNGTPLILNGGAITNSTLNPANLTFNYAGNGTIDVNGGASTAAIVYAPNATVNLNGNADWYGSLVGNVFHDDGGAAIHYDRHLSATNLSPGPWLLNSFSWSKY